MTRGTSVGAEILKSQRLLWLDAAKGGAIILVVLHHSILSLTASDMAHPAYIQLDALLKQMRMPLFFFASGIATSFLIHLPVRELFARKLLPIAWIFFFWSLVLGIAFEGVAQTAPWAQGGALWYLANVFFHPGYGMWFVLALGLMCLIAFQTRSLSPVLVIAAALAMTIHNDLSLFPRRFPLFPDWIVHNFLNYTLFFFLGLYSPRVIEIGAFSPPQIWRFLAAGLTAFAALNILGHLSPKFLELSQTLRATSGTVVGLCAALLVSRLERIGPALAWFGTRSLGVFVGHGLILIPLAWLLNHYAHEVPAAAVAFPPLLTLLSVAGSVMLFEALCRLRLTWLYVLPPRVGRAIASRVPVLPDNAGRVP